MVVSDIINITKIQKLSLSKQNTNTKTDSIPQRHHIITLLGIHYVYLGQNIQEWTK